MPFRMFVKKYHLLVYDLSEHFLGRSEQKCSSPRFSAVLRLLLRAIGTIFGIGGIEYGISAGLISHRGEDDNFFIVWLELGIPHKSQCLSPPPVPQSSRSSKKLDLSFPAILIHGKSIHGISCCTKNATRS
jgi:hypothetical protein